MILSAFLVLLSLTFFPHSSPSWSAPLEGPPAQANKKIIFIASDLNNGGVLGVRAGFMEATRALSWDVDVQEGAGDQTELNKLARAALLSKADGIVLCGFHLDEAFRELIRKKKKQKAIVGWHAGAKPGASEDLFANVTTDPQVVVDLAVASVQKFGNKNPGVIIISDNQFSIASKKAQLMAEALKKCKTCKLLSIENVSISKAPAEVSHFVSSMNSKFGSQWTHTLAINDIYFDHMNFPLKEIGRNDIVNIAAGDGSVVAVSRIRSGRSQQVATVAEPLMAQGWQLADELNRSFAGKNTSGFVSKPILITKQTLEKIPSGDIEANLTFRQIYLSIWKKH